MIFKAVAFPAIFSIHGRSQGAAVRAATATLLSFPIVSMP